MYNKGPRISKHMHRNFHCKKCINPPLDTHREMYPCPIIAKHGQECRISDDRSTSIYKSAASRHNWDAVPPNLPLSAWQILDTSGIVGSRGHTRLRIHSMISNRTGQNSDGGLKHPLYATPENISRSYPQKSARAALFPLNTVCINGLLKGKREKKSQHFYATHAS